MTNNSPLQLALGVRLRADATFENFITGDNGLAVLQLQALSLGRSREQSIVIHGQPGSGCTYLLQACCHASESAGWPAIYLPLKDAREFGVATLEGLDRFSLVCLDQLEAVVGLAEWEEALFHLFNRLRDQGSRLVIAAANRPDALGLCLQDLTSRLNWGLILNIRPLNDEQKLEALQVHARALGWNLSNEVGTYILKHGERDLGTLYANIELIDQISLRDQRRITIPFVKQVLGWS